MKIQFLFQNESIFVLNLNTASVNSVVSVIPAHMVLQSSAKTCLVKANKVGVTGRHHLCTPVLVVRR